MDNRDFLNMLSDSHEREVRLEHFEELNNFFCSKNHNFYITHFNICSLRKHFDELLITINSIQYKPDIIALSETFNFDELSEVYIPGYNCLYNKSKINKNDGLIIYIKNDISYNSQVCTYNHFNFLKIVIEMENKSISINSIYRPPSTNESDFTASLDEHLKNEQNQNSELNFFIGDINIDILKENNKDTNDYLNCLSKYDYISYINTPTRETTDTRTCIDHIFVKSAKNSLSKILPFIINNSLTDHYPIAVIIQSQTPVEKSKPKLIEKIDYTKLQTILSNQNWNTVTIKLDSNSSTNTFIDIIQNATCSSTKIIHITNRKTKLKPWITNGIITAIRTRDKLKQKLIKNKDNNELKNKYIYYRNKINSLIKVEKNNYYKQQLNKYNNDPKNTWRTINEICNKTRGNNNNIQQIKVQNKTITDDLDKANHFNAYFANIGHTIASQINTSGPEEQLPVTNHTNSMYIHPVNKATIIKHINNLKNTNTTGEDKITVKTLKSCHLSLLKPLKHIINTIFNTGIVPDCFKTTIIIPIFKNGDSTNMSNYRPIALISNVAKIFEKILKEQLESFLEKQKILSKNQYGFRASLSTTDAMYQLTSDVNESLSKSKKCLTVFLDLQKAFDTVNHQKLFTKCSNIGIRGFALSLFKSYLSTREQCVRINDKLSSKQQVTIGVPQGTVLAPLLFLIYVNDLCDIGVDGKLTAFADDQAATFSADTWENVIKKAEEGMNSIKNWLDHNHLSLNISKTKFICYSIYDKHSPNLETIHFDNNTIEAVDKTKYLGIIIDKNFKWQEHSLYITKKIRKLITHFYKLRDILSRTLILRIFDSLVGSVLRYGLAIWGGTYEMYLKPIHRITNYILRIILKKNRTYPSLELYKHLNILNFYQLYKLETICFVHTHPHFFTHINHTYRTRAITNSLLHTQLYNKTQPQNFLDYQGPKLYNSLSNAIKLIKNRKIFRKKTTDFLLIT